MAERVHGWILPMIKRFTRLILSDSSFPHPMNRFDPPKRVEHLFLTVQTKYASSWRQGTGGGTWRTTPINRMRPRRSADAARCHSGGLELARRGQLFFPCCVYPAFMSATVNGGGHLQHCRSRRRALCLADSPACPCAGHPDDQYRDKFISVVPACYRPSDDYDPQQSAP